MALLVGEGVDFHILGASGSHLEPLVHRHCHDFGANFVEALLPMDESMLQIFFVLLWEQTYQQRNFGMVWQLVPARFFVRPELFVQDVDRSG